MVYCRHCYRSVTMKKSIHIFSNEQTNPTIAEITKLYANIEILESDDFSKYICKTCYHLLLTFYYHRETVIKSDQLFRNNSKFRDTHAFKYEERQEEKLEEDYDDQLEEKYYEEFENKPSCSDIKIEDESEDEKFDFSLVKDEMDVDSEDEEEYDDCLLRISDSKKKLLCEKCGKTFQYARILKTHLRSHISDLPLKCHLCLAGFKYSYNLCRHLKKYH